jgi:hypothetical protein
MKPLMTAGLLVVMTMSGAPVAWANPDITDPYCTGGQTPLFGQCKPQPDVPDSQTSGLDPQVGIGLNPGSFPMI